MPANPDPADLIRLLREVQEAQLRVSQERVGDEKLAQKLEATMLAGPLFQEREVASWSTCGFAAERAMFEELSPYDFGPDSPDVRRFLESRLCIGIELGEDGRCFAHTSDSGARDSVLARLGEGESLGGQLRGVPLYEGMVQTILAAAKKDGRGRPTIRNADFTKASFSGARFTNAVFEEAALFEGTTFVDHVGFHATEFQVARADFTHARFEGEADFLGSVFAGTAFFEHTTFVGRARFDKAHFGGDWWGPAAFQGYVSLMSATFEETRTVGPIYSLQRVNLAGARFARPVVVQASAPEVSFENVHFASGADLQLRRAEVSFRWAVFGAPSTVRWAPIFEATGVSLGELGTDRELEERLPEPADADDSGQGTDRPRIVFLEEADVQGLAFSGVDLRACRFSRAQNIEKLRIGGTCEFASTPRHWRIVHRQVIAEEQQWRAWRGYVGNWYPAECRPSQPQDAPDAPDASEVAAVYRALRKGREDARDEPGAADFYYGEMEMRRLSAATPRAERWIIFLYWLTAGYGLRASRALASLAATVLVFGLGLDVWGFAREAPLVGSLLYSMQSTTSLLRAPEAELTYPGQAFQIALRLLGPLFFGLALLSLRGRVRR